MLIEYIVYVFTGVHCQSGVMLSVDTGSACCWSHAGTDQTVRSLWTNTGIPNTR